MTAAAAAEWLLLLLLPLCGNGKGGLQRTQGGTQERSPWAGVLGGRLLQVETFTPFKAVLSIPIAILDVPIGCKVSGKTNATCIDMFRPQAQ